MPLALQSVHSLHVGTTLTETIVQEVLLNSSLFLLCQSQVCLIKAIQFRLGPVKFSPEVHKGVTYVFTGFKLTIQ